MKLTEKRAILLLFGVIASILYIGTDILASSIYKGYSYTDQAISELSAVGAPTQQLWSVMLIFFEFSIILFGLGVWLSGVGVKGSIRISGGFLILWGIFGFMWLIFPMNMRGNTGSVSDTGHLVLSVLTPIIIFSFIGFGSGASGKRFRIYSIVTIIIMLIFGIWTGLFVSKVAAQIPTPGLGMIERVCVYSSIVWILVLAIILLKKQ